MPIEAGEMLPPFRRVLALIEGDIGPPLADQMLRVEEGANTVREIAEAMLAVGFPVPVGRRLGVVAEARLAPLQVAIGLGGSRLAAAQSGNERLLAPQLPQQAAGHQQQHRRPQGAAAAIPPEIIAPIRQHVLPGQRDGNHERHLGDAAETEDPLDAIER